MASVRNDNSLFFILHSETNLKFDRISSHRFLTSVASHISELHVFDRNDFVWFLAFLAFDLFNWNLV